MKFTKEKLDAIELHFLLCTERTGSSLLSLMLNLHPSILSPSEEPFALYIYRRYKNKTHWNEKDIINYVDLFYTLAEKNTDLYFSKRDIFIQNLINHRSILSFERLIKLTYLHFIDIKDKSSVTHIIDKQIKYFFHIPEIRNLFPNSKFIVLVRDVRDNIVSKQHRRLNGRSNPLYLSYLWRDTYRNTRYLPSNYKVVRYEDLVCQPKEELQKICDFLKIDFKDSMIQTEGVFTSFLADKEKDVDPKFVAHLKDFHSGLNRKPSESKIGQYKSLNLPVISEINWICQEEITTFGYELKDDFKVPSIIKRIYFSFLAKCYRKWLLAIYREIPLEFKCVIKKSKKRTNRP
jgi:hypothetical protein